MNALDVKKKEELNKRLSKEFPDFLMKANRSNGNAVTVTILEGPVDFNTNCKPINIFNYKEEYKGNNPAIDTLSKIIKVIDQVERMYTMIYGKKPICYKHISVGKWNSPYILRV